MLTIFTFISLLIFSIILTTSLNILANFLKKNEEEWPVDIWKLGMPELTRHKQKIHVPGVPPYYDSCGGLLCRSSPHQKADFTRTRTGISRVRRTFESIHAVFIIVMPTICFCFAEWSKRVPAIVQRVQRTLYRVGRKVCPWLSRTNPTSLIWCKEPAEKVTFMVNFKAFLFWTERVWFSMQKF